MKPLQLLILLMACGATGTPHILWAAEPAPAKPATPPAEKPVAESAAPKSDEDSQDKDDAPAAASPKTAASAADKAKPSPQRFVPSEQVRADFDVSFPIDI